MIASMKDGTGSEYFINFTEKGVIGKVYNHPNLQNLKHVSDCFFRI
jgi:hypothetical protein